MSSRLVITTPAADRNLLTASEMRVAVGLGSADASQDTALATLNARVSTMIARACRVAAAGIVPVTLRAETITETFRSGEAQESLILARRPVSSIVSIIEDGETIATAFYDLDEGAGILQRLDDDRAAMWLGEKATVVYVAGWDTVPDDLKLAASKVAGEIFAIGSRDPNLKRVDVVGVSEEEYWVSPTSDPLFSAEVQSLLAPFMNASVV